MKRGQIVQRIWIASGLVFALVAAWVSQVSAATITESAVLTASDGALGDSFGDAVAIDGTVAIVGAPLDDDDGDFSGSAYAFSLIGTAWTEAAKLTASDAATDDQFGSAVSISGSSVLVGAKGDDDGGSKSGSAYLFIESTGTWTEETKLTAGDASPSDEFGFAVALSGDLAVIGAPQNDDAGTNSGSVYVFARNGGAWTEEAKLVADDASAGAHFGYTVAIDGDTTMIGAFGDGELGPSAGAAYVFRRSVGATWSQEAKIIGSGIVTNDHFGTSVALFEDTALVGTMEADPMLNQPIGSVYVFERTGTAWNEEAKLTVPDLEPFDGFGNSVALSGEVPGRSGGRQER
ncbi:MAG: hypothetical protein GY925_20690 [Actinomycetia bacterium]|nr:hypothetical protein [Actinomycetes bacterium]